jgi:high affinity Mn2+ porin
LTRLKTQYGVNNSEFFPGGKRAAPQHPYHSALNWKAAVLPTLLSFVTVSQAQTGTSPVSTPPPQAQQAQESKPRDWNFHAQNTDIAQGDFGIAAKYEGPNSLGHKSEAKQTSTLDLFFGKRLWQGAEFHVDGLLWQGYGISKTLGIENFPNADAYKLGVRTPDFMFAHLFIRQTFGFGGAQEDVADGPLSLAGKQDINRLTLTVGRFSPADVADTNTYAGSAHTQFMSWGLVNNLSWDYAADSVGFAPGFTAELNRPTWTFRYGFFVLPPIPNSFTGDDEFLTWPHEGSFGPIFQDWAMNVEAEHRCSLGAKPGTIRYQAWLNKANMANYDQATAVLKANGPSGDWQATRSFRYKYGLGLNWEQQLNKNTGVFSRLGWNDGREEAWAFTDASWSASVGANFSGDTWKRPGDTVGTATVLSGASAQAQRFFQAGGLGILVGDGNLSYAPETSFELYYDTHLAKSVRCSLDYQLIANPAFNRDRGPVSVLGLRIHWEI